MTGTPKILILGAAGQVGVELQHSFRDAEHVIACDRETADLGNPKQLRNLISQVRPHVILNAAAYTAVDRAESEPELAMAINATAPRVLAEEAKRYGALLVHYSTDYVFDGTKLEPWLETDLPNPLSVYGRSKLAGEEAIQQTGGRYLIFRTSWVYGARGNNFLMTMLRLARDRNEISVVDDQFGAPTSSAEIARATSVIVSGALAGNFGAAEDWSGLYHMTCAGSTSWCGFAREIFARAERENQLKRVSLIPIFTADYVTPAKRPAYSVLANSKLHSRFNVMLPPWDEALHPVFDDLTSGNKAKLTAAAGQ